MTYHNRGESLWVGWIWRAQLRPLKKGLCVVQWPLDVGMGISNGQEDDCNIWCSDVIMHTKFWAAQGTAASRSALRLSPSLAATSTRSGYAEIHTNETYVGGYVRRYGTLHEGKLPRPRRLLHPRCVLIRSFIRSPGISRRQRT